MRLNKEVLCDRPPLDEGDPLPPEDKVSGGAGDWLDCLYRDHRHRLSRFARRYVATENAPDIVQQLFTRLAARAVPLPASIQSPAGYLCKAARNLIIDEVRVAKRHVTHLHVCSDEANLRGPDPIAALEARDMLQRLEVVVARLKPRTREIFLAHRIDGYSYQEIAARTGLSIKTVEKHMSRAIAYIGRHLNG